MFTLDLSAFERKAKELNLAASEVPFALANALTSAVWAAKDVLVKETWPSHVEVRDPGFLKASLKVKSATAREYRAGGVMRAELYDSRGRAHLNLHDKGGTKQARGRLAIPSREVKRTRRGVSARQKPSALPNSFKKGDVIYQRTGRKGRRLKLMYTLKPSVRIRPDVPFSKTFERIVRAEVFQRFPAALRKAVARPRSVRTR